MAAIGWKPTAANYLGRVSKARILEAVTEAKGPPAAEWIENLRKQDMAQQAERMLADTGWLPEPLRTQGLASLPVAADLAPPDVPLTQSVEVGDDLPSFLTEAA